MLNLCFANMHDFAFVDIKHRYISTLVLCKDGVVDIDDVKSVLLGTISSSYVIVH